MDRDEPGYMDMGDNHMVAYSTIAQMKLELHQVHNNKTDLQK